MIQVCGDEGTVLNLAAARGLTDIVSIFLQAGVDPNLEGGIFGAAIQAAAATGHLDIVQLLLDRGATADRLHGAFGSANLAALSGTPDSHHRIAALLLEPLSPGPGQEGCLWPKALHIHTEVLHTGKKWSHYRLSSLRRILQCMISDNAGRIGNRGWPQ